MASIVSNVTFGADVAKWVQKTEERMTAVFRSSTQKVVAEMQRNIPVDTGFARASIQASKESLPQIIPGSRGEKGSTYTPPSGDILAVIISAKFGETLYVGYTASYAIYLEYGHSQQAPNGFVRVAATQWQRFVKESVAELRGAILSQGGTL